MSSALVYSSAIGEARQSTLVDGLHVAYLAGEPNLFARAFPERQAFAAARDELIRAAQVKTPVWAPSRAGLALELAIGAIDRKWPDGVRLLTAAMQQVTSRPAAPGQDARGDRFESVFHYAALGTLLGNNLTLTAERYVDTLAGRISNTPMPGRAVLNDARWPLMLGWLAETLTAPTQDGLVDTGHLPSLVVASRFRRTLERVEGMLAIAAAAPNAPREALVRHAFALHRLGRNRAAALELAQVSPESVADDAYLRYWRALVAGRVHEALDAGAEAERAYADAHHAWPLGQTALIALGSLLERRGRPAEAERWIARVREMPADAVDPWWDYWTGDRRRVAAWLIELREARP